MRRDAMLDRDILKDVHDHEEDRPLLDLRTVFSIPVRNVNDEQDRRLLARAEAHLKLLDEEGLVEADPFHTMPAGGWHHSRPIERGPRAPYPYLVRLTWRGHALLKSIRGRLLLKVPAWPWLVGGLTWLWRLQRAVETWADNPTD